MVLVLLNEFILVLTNINRSTMETATASTLIVTIYGNFPTIFDIAGFDFFDLCDTSTTRALRHYIFLLWFLTVIIILRKTNLSRTISICSTDNLPVGRGGELAFPSGAVYARV
jgi:hypothetical protein